MLIILLYRFKVYQYSAGADHKPLFVISSGYRITILSTAKDYFPFFNEVCPHSIVTIYYAAFLRRAQNDN